jgi:pimeloyl-ACP methyl ester carboxylesterase
MISTGRFLHRMLLATMTLISSTVQDPTLPLSVDDSFKFELLVPLSEALYGGADIGPILGLAQEIEPGNFSSFSSAFRTLADNTKAAAQDADNAYNPINVRDTWFSASNYYRRADFYLHANWSDPLINSLWEEQTAAFDKAMAALPIPGQRIQISAENFTVEAIWYSPSRENSKRPTLILGNGYDAAQEDMYHTLVVPALALGWNCLTYEGPGQPTVRRNQNLGFIPNWELVVTPVVDYLLEHFNEKVDTSRLVLLGNSFGGYLAARAAAFEPRLSAVILDGGVYDFYAGIVNQVPPSFITGFECGNKSAFDAFAFAMLSNSSESSSLRWGLAQGLWSFNIASPFDFLKAAQQYTVKDFISRISVPVWIANAEYDQFYPGQPKMVANALGANATLHNFTGVAGYHTQTGAYQELARIMFSWLNKTLK